MGVVTDFVLILLTVAGLSLFEIVSSVDNAVINADVLKTMSDKGRRWFLTWGLFFAVFLMRGVLPFLIVFMLDPSRGIWGTLTAVFSSDPAIVQSLQQSSPPLLAAGGVFLLFLFLHWLFTEPKNYTLLGERFIHRHSAWFYASVSILLTIIIWIGLSPNPLIAFGAAAGSSLFFITTGFKDNAERKEHEMLNKTGMSDISKLLYLEVIDASFSIDGILGAFAFTLAVPLILIGNGIGAIVLRNVTIGSIDRVKKYKYLKNGAMYSIAVLGMIMIFESFHILVPVWISPIATIVILSYFFMKSYRELKKEEKYVPGRMAGK
ncbi:MAG: DUF475 domain-containing protein [Candidatus Aenigmarchaeota archaeon]|nr:DUF475 domain-containing protein [Candidatus Aenigmarchaeota archaeon]